MCHLYGKLGYFQSVCQSPAHLVRGIHTTNSVSLTFTNESNKYNDQSEDRFLGAMTCKISLKNQWLVTVESNGVPAEFNINTGAEVMVIKYLYHQVGSSCLTVPDEGANNKPSAFKACLLATFTTCDADQQCYVISG